MKPTFKVLFDLKTNEEIVIYEKLQKQGKNYISSPTLYPHPKPLGSFLLDFLNTNMHKRTNIEKFITEYCFLDYYSIFNKNYKEKYINYTFTISEDEYLKTLNKIYKKFGEDFMLFYDAYRNIALKKYSYKHIYLTEKYTDPKLSKLYKNKLDSLKPINYLEDLDEFEGTGPIGDIVIDFNYDGFEEFTIPTYIPYTYKISTYTDILYLTIRQLASSKYLICKCENCGKFFIPYTNHDTKYCNNVFKDNKTCKELAPKLAYKNKLEQDPLLKKYRSRYQTLQKMSSINPERNIERYENFKKIGPIKRNDYLNNKITAKEFEYWIESTKLRNSNTKKSG